MKEELTDRQRDVLKFIEDRIHDSGRPPTIREIGARFDIRSTNGVRAHLKALMRKGYLKKQDFVSRGLKLARDPSAGTRRVPLVGLVPAGLPIDAIENTEGEVAVDASFVASDDAFCLRVTGESMIGAGIHDGDLVIVRKQAEAGKGDIVVAIVDGEATVKRYFPEADQVRLQPENDSFAPIIVDRQSGEFRIAGRVVGLLRRF